MACTYVLAPSTKRAHRPSSLVGVKSRRGSRVSTAIRLPADLHAELQRQAAERDVSVNFIVTKAVAHYLKALGPADPLAASDDQEGALT
jgi:hypothetical protein